MTMKQIIERASDKRLRAADLRAQAGVVSVDAT